MKTLTTLALAALVAFSMIGCQSSDAGTKTEPSSPPKGETVTPDK